MALSKLAQMAMELSLIRYNKVFTKLTKKQQKKITDEVFKLEHELNLDNDQIDQYFARLMFGNGEKQK